MVTILQPTEEMSSPWAQPTRPWLTLYGLRVKQQREAPKAEVVELALIQKLLPEELVLKVFELLDPYVLGRLACVCSQWRAWTTYSPLWKSACFEAFQADQPSELAALQRRLYRGSWRDMFLQRPHMRFDGLYVSRNTYLRKGLTEWRYKNPVHLVTYFRYLRFLPDGSFITRTSPEVVSRVAKSLRKVPTVVTADEPVQVGRWQLNKDKLRIDYRIPNDARTELRQQLLLRSTVLGGNNRLDVLKIMSFDRRDSTLSLIDEGGAEDEDAVIPGAQTHNRGNGTYVFVPDEQVSTHILNQTDLSKMDYFLPG